MTDNDTLDVAYRGEPHVYMYADLTFDIAYRGEPFITVGSDSVPGGKSLMDGFDSALLNGIMVR